MNASGMSLRASAVCSGVVRYGCAPAERSRRQLQHLRAEGGHHTAVLRYAVLVEFVEIVGQRLDRLAVLLVRLGVADADAEDEAARVGLLDPVERLGGRARFGGPDVDDPGGELAACSSPREWDPPTTARQRVSRPPRWLRSRGTRCHAADQGTAAATWNGGRTRRTCRDWVWSWFIQPTAHRRLFRFTPAEPTP